MLIDCSKKTWWTYTPKLVGESKSSCYIIVDCILLAVVWEFLWYLTLKLDM